MSVPKLIKNPHEDARDLYVDGAFVNHLPPGEDAVAFVPGDDSETIEFRVPHSPADEAEAEAPVVRKRKTPTA